MNTPKPTEIADTARLLLENFLQTGDHDALLNFELEVRKLGWSGDRERETSIGFFLKWKP